MHIYWDDSLIIDNNSKTIQVVTRNRGVSATNENISFAKGIVKLYSWADSTEPSSLSPVRIPDFTDVTKSYKTMDTFLMFDVLYDRYFENPANTSGAYSPIEFDFRPRNNDINAGEVIVIKIKQATTNLGGLGNVNKVNLDTMKNILICKINNVE